MKISTYRKVLIAVQVMTLTVIFNDDKWLPLVFPTNTPTIITTTSAPFWCALLFVPVVLIVLQRFFTYNGHKKMTKTGKAFFTGILVLAIVLPLMFVPARTEVTSKAVTKHNILGNVTKVYEFKDANKVKAELQVYSGGKSIIARMGFTYEVIFEDGYTETFTDIDLDENWIVVKAIDNTVRNNNIEKELYGKALLDSIYDYSGVGYVGDKVRELME